MKRKTNLPELLAPAGNMQALLSAVYSGADAVYVGGVRFGARAFADNFDNDGLRRAVLICHSRGVRLYVTVNTLILDHELNEALEYCRYLYGIGVDALIVCDLGLIRLLTRELPELEIHASTQMGVHNTEGADAAYSLGLKRVVLARECSREDIASVVDASAAECEVFVHGALCVCHSGQCLFSSLVGGRSGNRGECAQPCRLPYNGRPLLSLSDLSLAMHIPWLIESGVASLKIEGRMKSAEYVGTVVSVFRRLIDENRTASADEMRELERAFSREGFTDGYFKGEKFSKMTGVRRESDKADSRGLSSGPLSVQRLGIGAYACISEGQAARLEYRLTVSDRLYLNEATLFGSYSGRAPSPALSSPLTRDSVTERLSKLGGTLFFLKDGEMELELAPGLNLPPSALNELRREALGALEGQLLRPMRTIFGLDEGPCASGAALSNLTAAPTDIKGGVLHTAVFHSPEVLTELYFSSKRENGKKSARADSRALNEAGIKEISQDSKRREADERGEGGKGLAKSPLSLLDIVFIPLEGISQLPSEITADGDLCIGVMLPPVIMDSEREEVKRLLCKASSVGIRYALVSNISASRLLSGFDFRMIGDFRLNIYNSEAKRLVLERFGISEVLLSPELTLPQARDINGGVIVMGRIPLMITERCFVKESFGCEKCGRAELTDRYGVSFPIRMAFGHRNLIFNSTLTYMGERAAELERARLRHRHMIFSTENADTAQFLLRSYFSSQPLKNMPVRRIGKR